MDSFDVHCPLREVRSASARASSSRSSSTFLSCAAIAIIKSFASSRAGSTGVCAGVGGFDESVAGGPADEGGRMGSTLDAGAMGSVSESLLACLEPEEAIECARACVNRLPWGRSLKGRGGGGMDSALMSFRTVPDNCCCREISSSLTCASAESGAGENVVDMAMIEVGESGLS